AFRQKIILSHTPFFQTVGQLSNLASFVTNAGFTVETLPKLWDRKWLDHSCAKQVSQMVNKSSASILLNAKNYHLSKAKKDPRRSNIQGLVIATCMKDWTAR